MKYSATVIAAFSALLATVQGVPVPGQHQPSWSYLSGNSNNGIVAGSGNGGAGGSNFALPIAFSGASSGTKGGKSTTVSEAGNAVGQNANGGDGFAVGTYGSHNVFSSRTDPSLVNVDPSVSVLSGNKDNGIVIASGNGGPGGSNVAVPIALSGAKSSSGGHHSSSQTGSQAGNGVHQSANGGSGSAVGTFGSGNTLCSRTHSSPSDSILSGNSGNGIVYGSGNGGAGGENVAVPIAVSGAQSWSHGGHSSTTGSVAVNGVYQNANGGSGSAVGSYGSHNWFERGSHTPPSYDVLSHNSANGIVVGSGNGGAGGENLAVPVAISGAQSSTKHGSSWTGSAAGNTVKQSANGGDGSAVGTYGEHDWFGRGEKPSFSYLSNNNDNGIVVGSGNGGAGGVNYAIPIAASGAKSSTGGWHGSSWTGSAAGNVVGQNANGGDGGAVGSYGSGNHFH